MKMTPFKVSGLIFVHHFLRLPHYLNIGNRNFCNGALSPTATYYVGDEVRDVEATHAAKINSLAVSRGFNSNAKLKQASPTQLINNFDELESMFYEECPHPHYKELYSAYDSSIINCV